MAALAGVTLGGVWLGSAVIARHRAQAAADLAALAAARDVPAGLAVACRDAVVLSAAVGALVVSCALDGLDIVVEVQVDSAARFGGAARASARGGPAEG